MEEQIQYMRRALEISRQSFQLPGTLPFGSVIVKNDKIVGEGLNRTYEKYDPTSHGEIEAIRNACANLKTTDLSQCDLYTSCEPCSMCIATIYLAGIKKLFYASTLTESSKFFENLAKRNSKWIRRISSHDLRMEVGRPVEQRSIDSNQICQIEANSVYNEYLKHNYSSSTG